MSPSLLAGQVERELGRARVELGEGGEEVLLDRVHASAVVGHPDGEELREDLLVPQRAGQFGQRVLVAGQGHPGRAVDGGDRDPVAVGGDPAGGLLLGQADGEHRAGPDQLLLEPGPVHGDPRRVLQGVDAGLVEGGDLPGAVADDRVGVDSPGSPEGRQPDLDREVRRLRQPGLGHLGVGLAGVHLLDQRPVGEQPERGVTPFHGLAVHRLRLEELAAHRPPLRSHAGEHPGQPAVPRVPALVDEQVWVRLAPGELGEAVLEGLPGRVDDRQAVLQVLAAAGEGVAEVGEADGFVFTREFGPDVPGELGQRLGVTGGQGQDAELPGRGTLHTGRADRCLLEQDVGVGAAEAEGVDPGAGRPLVLRPVGDRGGDLVGQGVEVDGRVDLVQVDVRRDRPVLQAQHRLDEAGDPGGGLRVPDVRLDRADVAARSGCPPDGEGAAECVGLDRVTHGGGGAVGLHVLEVARLDARVRADPFDEADLGVRVGDRDAVGPAVLVDTAGCDDGVDGVAVPDRLVEELERDHSDSLGTDVAVGRRVEGAGPAVRRQEPALGLRDGVLRGEVQQGAAGQRELGLTPAQALAGQVHRDQRGAARGVDRDAGSPEVEAVGDPVRHHRHHRAGRGVGREGLEAEVGELEDLVVEGEGTDEDTDVAAGEFTGALPAVLERLPGHLQQLPLLGVHVLGLTRADPEEGGVELVEAVDVPTSAADQASGLGLVAAAERPHVVPVGRGVGDAVLAGQEVLPERPVVGSAAGQPATDTDDRDPVAGWGVT